MRTSWLALAGVAVAGLLVAPDAARSFDVVRYEEATIADIQGAFNAKTLKCRALVQMYLERIAAYDKKGPALNAIVVTNPDALKLAETLDARFVQSGLVGPIHCVPLIVKDNYETTDMPTSAGSLSLKGVMMFEGMGTRARLEGPPGQPRSGVERRDAILAFYN